MEQRSRKVLVIDDTAEDRQLLRRLLADCEPAYDLIEAETGEEGLRLYQEQTFDCVLLDFRLPDMTGLEVLHSLPTDAPLPVVMITAQGSESVAAQAIKDGAQDYLIKGELTRDNLSRAIEYAIEKIVLRKRIAGLERELDALRELADRLKD